MSRLSKIFAAIDGLNAQDPNRITVEGAQQPAELVYGERMSAALARLYPEASDELRIAARAQHIQRWSVPRDAYPPGRKGYLAWRNDLKRRHAETAAQLMSEQGFTEAQIARVGKLLRKEGLKRDPEVQALEDVACIVFLEHYLEAFAAGHDDDKVIAILRKTWRKMSPRAHEAARALELPPAAGRLVAKALEAPAS
ncbi:MAG: hypothetical protein Kow0032_17440 [Methyloligellaceae bacterium]